MSPLLCSEGNSTLGVWRDDDLVIIESNFILRSKSIEFWTRIEELSNSSRWSISIPRIELCLQAFRRRRRWPQVDDSCILVDRASNQSCREILTSRSKENEQLLINSLTVRGYWLGVFILLASISWWLLVHMSLIFLDQVLLRLVIIPRCSKTWLISVHSSRSSLWEWLTRNGLLQSQTSSLLEDQLNSCYLKRHRITLSSNLTWSLNRSPSNSWRESWKLSSKVDDQFMYQELSCTCKPLDEEEDILMWVVLLSWRLEVSSAR